MRNQSKWFKVGVPLLILAAGAGLMWLMIASRSVPRKEERKNPGALVETLAVARGRRQVQVHGTGTVQPRQEIDVTPQVSGRVTEISPRLVAGGFFRAGEILFRIDDADYRLALDRAQAALARAEYELAAMEGQARIARQEWRRLQSGAAEEPNPLVLYEPQLKNARASLLSARASVRQAELDLERTVLRAPFHAVVRSESVDLGQYLRAGAAVAALAGTDRAEIVVPLPLEELNWLQIPGPGKTFPGARATVELRAGEATFRWPGRVVRRLGDVDPQGRMSRLVVAVDDPYGLRGDDRQRPELAMGTFVQVTLYGRELQDVAVIPAAALRDGATVWLMNDEHLSIRSVQVVRRARDQVMVDSGLAAGDLVVLTNLGGAAEGMKLRTVGQTEAVTAAPEGGEAIR